MTGAQISPNTTDTVTEDGKKKRKGKKPMKSHKI